MAKEMAQSRQNLEGTPDIEEAAELISLAGNSTRLKLLYLLENMKELCVSDLAEMLGISVSAVSQHLAKLKAYGLVAPRRDAQTIYYRLSDHNFNGKLRESFFRQFEDGPAEEPGRERCFPASTRVAIPGGTDRPISELRPGDLVCSWDIGRGTLAQGRVTRILTGKAARLIRVNGGLMASPDHRILTARGYLRFDEIRAGDTLVRFPGAEGQWVREIDIVQGEMLVYNLEVSPCASFFAEGWVVEDYAGGDEDDGAARLQETVDLPEKAPIPDPSPAERERGNPSAQTR